MKYERAKPFSAESRRGRKEHVPTAETRKIVSALSACGMPQEQIADTIQVSAKTLRKHYADDITTTPEAAVLIAASRAESMLKAFEFIRPGLQAIRDMGDSPRDEVRDGAYKIVSNDLERAVLGAIILDNECFSGIPGRQFEKMGVDFVKPETFGNALNRSAYEIIGKILNGGGKVTPESLKYILIQRELISRDSLYVQELVAARPSEPMPFGSPWHYVMAMQVLNEVLRPKEKREAASESAALKDEPSPQQAHVPSRPRYGPEEFKDVWKYRRDGEMLAGAGAGLQGNALKQKNATKKPHDRVPRFISIEDENEKETVE